MKSFFILTLALGLLAGCGAKNDKHPCKQIPAPKSDPGAAFLAENAKKEGVTTTASGLQYKVIKSGMGESPKLIRYGQGALPGHVD